MRPPRPERTHKTAYEGVSAASAEHGAQNPLLHRKHLLFQRCKSVHPAHLLSVISPHMRPQSESISAPAALVKEIFNLRNGRARLMI